MNVTRIPTNQVNEDANKNPKEISIRTKDGTLKMKNPVRFREDCDGGDGDACAVLSSLLLLNGEISQKAPKICLKKAATSLTVAKVARDSQAMRIEIRKRAENCTKKHASSVMAKAALCSVTSRILMMTTKKRVRDTLSDRVSCDLRRRAIF